MDDAAASFPAQALMTEAPPTEMPAHPMSDDPSLVETLKECFANLAKGNEEQTEMVLDALKPKAPPAMDKEATFWNAYKTLSEEYDREFHKKYGTDLDTSLIFAGLFSAVSSAFIIQIQPELQQDPNKVTQQLLRILIHNANQSLFSGIDMAEPSGGTTTTVIIVQSLLYASLFSTLLAALLAVLGKQWLMHYDAAGSRGTLEQRGLERQRKYNGLQKWKFTLVMEMFPLLLQLALLLFSAALSVYLSTISHTIASIVIAMTSLGTLAYISQLVSAAVYPDSPFQTPLASVLRRLVVGLLKTILALPAFLHQILNRIQKFLQQQSISPLLPLFRWNISSDDGNTGLSTPSPFTTEFFPEASPEVPAVVWLLETSTNPDVISVAADLAVDLQWPRHADLGLALDRLHDTFHACFIVTMEQDSSQFQVRDSSIQHAITCGQAYGTMSISSRRNTGKLIYSFQNLIPPRAEGAKSSQLAQLHTVFNSLKGDSKCLHGVHTQPVMEWVLHVLPQTIEILRFRFAKFPHLKDMVNGASTSQAGLTKQNYADCLIFLNIMLGFKAHPDILMWKDKSFAIDFLVEELFKNLSKYLHKNPIRMTMAKDIITLTNQMATMSGHMPKDSNSRIKIRKQVYSLCTAIVHAYSWVDVVAAALAFGDLSGYALLEDVSWGYAALQDGQPSSDDIETDWDAATEERVLQLLKALNDATEFPAPSKKVLQIILKALSTEAPCSNQALKLLYKAKSWFIDTDFQSIMQKHNVWSRMGSAIMKNLSGISRHSLKAYISLGKMLSSLTQWTPHIRCNLSHWITIYSQMYRTDHEELMTPYLSVLEHIWGVKYTGTYQFTEDTEKILAWTVIALSIVWEGFDFSSPQTSQDLDLLIRYTISTAFKSHYRIVESRLSVVNALISPNFRATFYTPLGDALFQAATKARDMIPDVPTQSDNQLDLDSSQQGKTQILQQGATILNKMGLALKHESEGEQVDRGEMRAREYWDTLRTHFEQQVDGMEKSLKETPGTAKISH
ncbi:hypothetical protein C8J57DRAFT_1681116 [Mycena rebaudengoi]|nr:hypothetical protein C8J57DRAFT_1681116 [Mycena rebaudengoi]